MDTVYRFTLEAVDYLFSRGCNLVVLACNTASAKALRSIQQINLPDYWAKDGTRVKRVLGVIIPSVEVLDRFTHNGHVGILATPGTVQSRSYQMEMAKIHPDFKVTAHACPLWVPLVENGEADSPGADYFIRKDIDALMASDPEIDTILLGCTHYPHLLPKILRYVPEGVAVVSQGELIAASLKDYLRRHPEIESECTQGGTLEYLTTESSVKFSEMATLFMGSPVSPTQITL